MWAANEDTTSGCNLSSTLLTSVLGESSISEESVDWPDEHAVALYLEVPRSLVVLFQAYFELYEGLGVVRTLDLRKNLVCVLTTNSLLPSCLSALESLRADIGWNSAPRPSKEERERYLGYFKHATNVSKI